jgi:hypothetical protein
MNTLVFTAGLLSVCTGFSFPWPLVGHSPHLVAINLVCRFPTLLPSSITSNEDLLPEITAIDDANERISELLEDLLRTPYFRLYSVDILASCEYMPQELFECYSET